MAIMTIEIVRAAPGPRGPCADAGLAHLVGLIRSLSTPPVGCVTHHRCAVG